MNAWQAVPESASPASHTLLSTKALPTHIHKHLFRLEITKRLVFYTGISRFVRMCVRLRKSRDDLSITVLSPVNTYYYWKSLSEAKSPKTLNHGS